MRFIKGFFRIRAQRAHLNYSLFIIHFSLKSGEIQIVCEADTLTRRQAYFTYRKAVNFTRRKPNFTHRRWISLYKKGTVLRTVPFLYCKLAVIKICVEAALF